MVTLFRFVKAAFSCRITIKLKILLFSLILSAILCLIFQHLNLLTLTLLFGSVGYGASCSAIFPLMLSIPAEYGLKFRPEQIANIMVAAHLSSGVISAITGQIMSWKIDLLFYWLTVMSIWLCINSLIIFEKMEKEGKI